MRTITLDNEAVQALASPTHAKHRTVVAHLQGVTGRRRRGRVIDVVVPTAVRVEAGWDRSRPDAAALNRFRVRDHVLDRSAADVAAGFVAAGVVGSVADAHIGVTARDAAGGDIVVLSSDPRDMAAVCGSTPATIVAI